MSLLALTYPGILVQFQMKRSLPSQKLMLKLRRRVPNSKTHQMNPPTLLRNRNLHLTTISKERMVSAHRTVAKRRMIRPALTPFTLQIL